MKTRQEPAAGFKLFRTFTARVTTLVLTTVIVFSAALGLGVYSLVTGWQADAALESLSALATAREYAIEAQIGSYLDVGNAFVAPDLGFEVEQLLAAEGVEAEILREALLQSMRRKLRSNTLIESAQVVDLENRVVIQTDPGAEPYLDVGSPLFRQAVLKPTLSTPRYDVDDTPHVEIAVPLSDGRGNTIALLVLRESAAGILSIAGDYTGLGETGETVLGERTGDVLRFLLPLRFAPDPSGLDTIQISGELAGPMVRATAGQTGITRSLDYRGIPVIAAFRPIRQTGWGLVVKQNEAEIFATARELRGSLAMLLAVLLGLSAVAVIPLLGRFTQPLRTLGEAMEQVMAGNLDVRVREPTDVETGTLARGFNQMIQRIRSSQADLERRNEELASFAHVVSHDLKAPLRGVASLSQWIKEDLADRLDDESRAHLDLMQERIGRMDALIDGLLDFARAGQARSAPIKVDVERLIATVVADLEPLDGMSVEAVTSLPVVFGDEIRLRQVFQNLIGNAVGHHPGPTGRVEISCTDSGEMWEFSVSDDGDGIDPRHHERIFMIFERLRAQPDVDSTGVGLAVTKKIVENAGGTIRVRSDGVPGAGSTFHFTWPKKEGNSR